MKRAWPCVAVFVLAGWLPVLAQDAGSAQHKKVYDHVRESVVGIRAAAPVLGERSGTGIVLDKEGYILTSSTIVPERSQYVKVWLSGPRFRKAHIIGVSKRDEVTLIKIDPTDLDLKPIEFGESSKVQIGEMAYTIGNSYNSIIIDNQPSFNTGVVSGKYRLREDRVDSTYIGEVIESTAAVNPGMEGAPLLDARGRMIGLVTPNFSTSRWLGDSIPVDVLKEAIQKLKDSPAPADPSDEPAVGTGAADLGIKLVDDHGKVKIQSVDPGSPAWDAGLREGDIVTKLSGTPLKSSQQVMEKVKTMSAGATVWFTVDVGGEGVMQDVKIRLTAKKPE